MLNELEQVYSRLSLVLWKVRLISRLYFYGEGNTVLGLVCSATCIATYCSKMLFLIVF